MIQGLFIDVTSAELRTMLEGRLKYHMDKVRLYKEQHQKLEEIDAALGEDAKKIGKGGTNSPTDSVEQSIKRHESQVVYYKFMTEHVIPNEVYRLGEQELLRLGVQSERMY